MRKVIRLLVFIFLGFYISNISVLANNDVKGEVLSDGIGVPNIYVKIYDENNKRLRDEKTGEALNARTDDRGRFKFSSINNGNYIIRLRKDETIKEFVVSDDSNFDGNELAIKIKVPLKKELKVEVKGYKSLSDKENAITKWLNKWEWQPILTSIKTAVVGILFTFILGLLLVRLIRSVNVKIIKHILDAVLTLPLVLPPTVIGFFLLRILGVNSIIGKIFLDIFNFKIVFSWESTVIAAVVLSLPLMYKSTMGAIDQVDENLIYAARTLGFSERKIFWKILIPNAVPGIASATILAFARGMGEYGATSMIAGNILGKTRTLPIAVAITTSAGQDDQANFYAAIIVIIAMILITAMNIITLKISKRR